MTLYQKFPHAESIWSLQLKYNPVRPEEFPRYCTQCTTCMVNYPAGWKAWHWPLSGSCISNSETFGTVVSRGPIPLYAGRAIFTSGTKCGPRVSLYRNLVLPLPACRDSKGASHLHTAPLWPYLYMDTSGFTLYQFHPVLHYQLDLHE